MKRHALECLVAQALLTASPLADWPAAAAAQAAVALRSNIDLTHWRLTLPTGRKHDPTEILAPQLSSGYQNSRYFTDTSAGLYFFAPVDGLTTKGSSYPRSELREGNPDGSLYNWHDTDFRTSELSATLRVVQLPSTGKLVVGQIHGLQNGQPLVKLEVDNGNLKALARDKPAGSSVSHPLNGPDGKQLHFAIGESFSYRIKVGNSVDGKTQSLGVSINGNEVWSQQLDASWRDVGLYFKAGAYVQDNTGPSTEGGGAIFTALSIGHKK
jgi:hypothetical protein